MKSVTSVFSSPRAAESAVEELLDADFSPGEISLVMSEERRMQSYPPHRIYTGEEAAVAGGLAAVLGNLVPAASMGGPAGVEVTGPILAFLAADGPAGGTLLDALVGAGIPEHPARAYAAHIAAGAIVVGVETDDEARAEDACDAFARVAGPAPGQTLHVADISP